MLKLIIAIIYIVASIICCGLLIYLFQSDDEAKKVYNEINNMAYQVLNEDRNCVIAFNCVWLAVCSLIWPIWAFWAIYVWFTF